MRKNSLKSNSDAFWLDVAGSLVLVNGALDILLSTPAGSRESVFTRQMTNIKACGQRKTNSRQSNTVLKINTRNVGQCPTWWSPCGTQVVPSVQRRKVWLMPTTRCLAVTLPRRETRWNLLGCPKLANRSQLLVGRSSPYYEDMWRTYRCLTTFSDCWYVP